MNSKTLVWVAVGAVLVAAAFFIFRPAGGGVQNVDQAGLIEAQQQGARVVDVRTVAEYEAGHIPGAENVPLDQISAAAASWDTAAPLVVYCQTGSRSQTAVQQLQSMGFSDIKHYNTGIMTWTGGLESGQAAVPSSDASAPATSGDGTPVMYEFYTDS